MMRESTLRKLAIVGQPVTLTPEQVAEIRETLPKPLDYRYGCKDCGASHRGEGVVEFVEEERPDGSRLVSYRCRGGCRPRGEWVCNKPFVGALCCNRKVGHRGGCGFDA